MGVPRTWWDEESGHLYVAEGSFGYRCVTATQVIKGQTQLPAWRNLVELIPQPSLYELERLREIERLAGELLSRDTSDLDPDLIDTYDELRELLPPRGMPIAAPDAPPHPYAGRKVRLILLGSRDDHPLSNWYVRTRVARDGSVSMDVPAGSTLRGVEVQVRKWLPWPSWFTVHRHTCPQLQHYGAAGTYHLSGVFDAAEAIGLVSETIKTHDATLCCGRTLLDTAGAWPHDNHAWGLSSIPLCCGRRRALWIRQECTCLAGRWIRRDSLPVGYPFSTAPPERKP